MIFFWVLCGRGFRAGLGQLEGLGLGRKLLLNAEGLQGSDAVVDGTSLESVPEKIKSPGNGGCSEIQHVAVIVLEQCDRALNISSFKTWFYSK